MEGLNDRVAIVTGAGQGIGREIALSLARAGAKVMVCDISNSRYDVARDIDREGVRALEAACDVTKKAEVEAMVQKAAQNLGNVDIMVNNAGIYPFKPFAEMSEQDWDRVMGINLKGAFNCCKAVLPGMMERHQGRIINLSSIAGSVVGFSGLVHYSASKAGVMGFTRALALEVAPFGINVNAIAPGPIDTPGAKAPDPKIYEMTRKTIPLGRLGQPADIAALAVFLAGDRASFITGQCIVADGGYTLQ